MLDQQMNKKQTKSRSSKMSQRRKDLRDELWPNVLQEELWSRHHRDGFTTIPRTMPLISRIIDSLGPSGRPVSATYLALWARVSDESIVQIDSEKEIAFESGFTGQRAVTTWLSRMSILEKHNLIQTKSGSKSTKQYVLLIDPYHTIKYLHDSGHVPESLYTPFFARAQEIGADSHL